MQFKNLFKGRPTRFLKAYGVALAGIILVAGIGIGSRPADRTKTSLKKEAARTRGVPSSNSAPVAPPRIGGRRSVPRPPSHTPPPPVFKPTHQLTPMLAALQSPMFAPDVIESAARFLSEEEEALRDERLLDPFQEFFSALGTDTPLADVIRGIIERHGDAGGRAIERFLEYESSRLALKLSESDDKREASRLDSRIQRVDKLRLELTRSITD